MNKMTGALLAFSSLALAAQVQEKVFSDTQPGYEIKCNELPAAYNAPARINPACPWDFFLNASFIYWQPQEGTLEVASYFALGHYEYKSMSLDFHPGFKVAIGLNPGLDDWDTYVEYVWLHTHDVNHFQTPSWASWINDAVDFESLSSMSAAFRLRYDMLEWSLGRYFYNGENLTLRPNLGIKGGWMGQRLATSGIDFVDPTFTDFSHSKMTSWLIGPRCGVNSKWLLGKGFRLFGDLDLSLLYQSFKGRYSQTILSDGHASTSSSSVSPHRITPNLGTILGLGWGSYFNHQKDHFDLSAGYEFQYYFHQNIFFKMSTDPWYGTSMDDLMLHGLTVKVQLDF